MDNYESKLSDFTWQEVYARFYNSLLAFAKEWEDLKTEEEKMVFLLDTDIGYSVEMFDQISKVCQHIREMPANPATLDEAAKVMIFALSIKAASLRTYKDVHGIQMTEYMFYLTGNF